MSQYLVSHLTTEYKDGDFNTLSWMSKQKDEVIDRIVSLSDSFFAKNNKGDFDSLDYLTFCNLIAEREMRGEEVSEKIIENSLMGVSLFAMYEVLRRKGVVEFNGSGKVSDFDKNNTEIQLTQAGRLISGSMSTLMEISRMMEEN